MRVIPSQGTIGQQCRRMYNRQEAQVDFENSLAVVHYDDTKTDLHTLVKTVVAGEYKSWCTDTEKK